MRVVAHAQGFECNEIFVPREVFMTTTDFPENSQGFLVNLSYWDFDTLDDSINERMSRKRHGLVYDKRDWTSGCQYERLESNARSLFNDLFVNEDILVNVVVDSWQQKNFFDSLDCFPVTVEVERSLSTTLLQQQQQEQEQQQQQQPLAFDDFAVVSPYVEEHHYPNVSKKMCSQWIAAAYARHLKRLDDSWESSK